MSPRLCGNLWLSEFGPAPGRLQPGRAASFGEFAHAQNIALPFSHGNHAARVKQIEDVRGLDALVIGGKDEQMTLAAIALLQQRLALGLGVGEMPE